MLDSDDAGHSVLAYPLPVPMEDSYSVSEGRKEFQNYNYIDASSLKLIKGEGYVTVSSHC